MKIAFSIILTALLCACGSEVPVVQAPVAKQAVHGPIVFMGDSLTSEWDSVPSDPNDFLTHLVPGSVNVAIPGQTTEQMLARFQTDVIPLHPYIVVILAGINDLILTDDPHTNNVAQMGAMAEAVGAQVVIATVTPSHIWIYSSIVTPETNELVIKRWNDELINLAVEKSWKMVDYYSAMILPDGTQNTALFQDNQHPNSDGYAVMWPVLNRTLSRIE